MQKCCEYQCHSCVLNTCYIVSHYKDVSNEQFNKSICISFLPILYFLCCSQTNQHAVARTSQVFLNPGLESLFPLAWNTFVWLGQQLECPLLSQASTQLSSLKNYPPDTVTTPQNSFHANYHVPIIFNLSFWHLSMGCEFLSFIHSCFLRGLAHSNPLARKQSTEWTIDIFERKGLSMWVWTLNPLEFFILGTSVFPVKGKEQNDSCTLMAASLYCLSYVRPFIA